MFCRIKLTDSSNWGMGEGDETVNANYPLYQDSPHVKRRFQAGVSRELPSMTPHDCSYQIVLWWVKNKMVSFFINTIQFRLVAHAQLDAPRLQVKITVYRRVLASCNV